MKTVYVNLSDKPYTEERLPREAREFLHGLLSDTRNQFRNAFIRMANSKAVKDQRKFVSLYANLAELVIPKPVVSTEVNEEEFQKLVTELEAKKGGHSC